MSDEATADALMGWRLVVGGGLGKQNRGEKREIVKLSNPMAVWQDSSRLKRGTLCITDAACCCCKMTEELSLQQRSNTYVLIIK